MPEVLAGDEDKLTAVGGDVEEENLRENNLDDGVSEAEVGADDFPLEKLVEVSGEEATSDKEELMLSGIVSS